MFWAILVILVLLTLIVILIADDLDVRANLKTERELRNPRNTTWLYTRGKRLP